MARPLLDESLTIPREPGRIGERLESMAEAFR